ncbi:hypothetical protein SLNWT_3766 [Streptomyces albus]|uniref:Uncharacterized protein n=1 Tax=Streptomyces albus (strain ATCC 21838 / DSM 41398 / FERM P-419 / JCM 4703 / NBRC 107858) TaxID=1081613 RepID=A0A0B5F1C8_STRA4|nr:hypothetical protein SLNWT_3766 [Streptomyces albus]AOU78447.1 hypothetical protein SLNHY_3756 [Streptomyces albus]
MRSARKHRKPPDFLRRRQCLQMYTHRRADVQHRPARIPGVHGGAGGDFNLTEKCRR